MKSHPSQTYKEIYHIISRIPEGRVATYGQIARISGRSTARQVGYALNALPDGSDIPWHRVINRHGMISPRKNSDGHLLQKILLEAEGLYPDEKGRIDLNINGWRTTEEL